MPACIDPHVRSRLKSIPYRLLLLAWISPVTAFALPPDSVQHVIVTTAPLESEFQRLADEWASGGISTSVVTLDWIATHAIPGVDTAETIRNFLHDAHEQWGTTSVLLGGDTEVLPTRIVNSNFFPPGETTDIRTDHYYACLDGDWDADGDGNFGELEDVGDMLPELAVGRAPVRSTAEASVFVDKTLAYMIEALNTSPKALLIAEILSTNSAGHITLDGAVLTEQYAPLLESAAPPFTLTRRYENLVGHPTALPLTKAAALAAMNSGEFQLVHLVAHGNSEAMGVGDDFVLPADVADLRNDVPFAMVAAFESSAAFAGNCLLEDLLRNPDGGAAVALGFSESLFYATTHEFLLRMYSNIISGASHGLGEAVRSTLEYDAPNSVQNSFSRWLALTITLLGDPLMPIGVATVVSLEHDETAPPNADLPAALRLIAPSPNPFNPMTRVRFALPQPAQVTLTVHDLKGRLIAKLADGLRSAGEYSVNWNGLDDAGRSQPTGTYVVRLRAGEFVQTTKAVLVR
ncbi:T9SS type A sorting domain-containing protein [bacterium]|nr:T9SS type A sorting domain-containing protein [bacterium]